MSRTRRTSDLALLSVVAALFLPVAGGSQSSQDTEEPAQPSKDGLQIELETDKQTYKAGEPIMVTVTLRNTGERTFLATCEPIVGMSAMGGHVSFELLGSDEETIPWGGIIGEFWGLGEVSLADWIARWKRPYYPGDFVGFTRSLEEIRYSAYPGRYRLTASYWETDYEGWVDEEELEKTKKKLSDPLWSGTITSQPVAFEIHP